MIEKKYKKPLIFAAFLHAIVLLVLIINVEPSHFSMPASSAPMNTIHASAITETAVAEEIQQVQQPLLQQQAEIRAEKQHEEKLAQEKAVAEKQHQLALVQAENAKIQAQKAAELKKKKANAEKKLAEQKKLAKIKEATLQKQQLSADKKAIQTEKQKKLAAEQKKLQQQLMAQQISSETKNISAVQSQAQAGAVDKYKAEILATIQSNWRIPEINSKLKCIYSVNIAPDGAVLSVQLVKSSGNDELDQSARQAINASSPLPVPNDPALFSHFRQLMLTLSPQGYLQSVGNA